MQHVYVTTPIYSYRIKMVGICSVFLLFLSALSLKATAAVIPRSGDSYSSSRSVSAAESEEESFGRGGIKSTVAVVKRPAKVRN